MGNQHSTIYSQYSTTSSIIVDNYNKNYNINNFQAKSNNYNNNMNNTECHYNTIISSVSHKK